MTAIQCQAPNCPDPTAPSPAWLSLHGYGLDGQAHPWCVAKLKRRPMPARKPMPPVPPRGPSEAPVVPCSSVDCKDPMGGTISPYGTGRPIRFRLEVEGETRIFCKTCCQRMRARIERGTPLDAPLRHEADDDDTGPEPTEAEIEAMWLIHGWELAGKTINYLLRPPKPPPLDDLRGPDFGRAVVEAFERKDLARIYQGIEMYEEVR